MYCSLLRSVLEYASVVFANLPTTIFAREKRTPRIIFGRGDWSNGEALARAGPLSREAGRHLACRKFVTEIVHARPLYPLISRRVVSSQSSYSLRSGPSCHADRFSEFVSVKYASSINCP